MNRLEFMRELAALINKYSLENASNTLDHILAAHLLMALENFESSTILREKWYGRNFATVEVLE